ncbi:MAG: hypothetical protein ACRDTT_34305, partial [Pseudonocardiaceae bacterium]
MEGRLGGDLSQVRVHTDEWPPRRRVPVTRSPARSAARSSSAMGARRLTRPRGDHER